MSPPTPLNAVRMAFLTSPGVATEVPACDAMGGERVAGVPVALTAPTAPAVPARAAAPIPIAITRGGGKARRMSRRRRMAPGRAVPASRGGATALARALALR